MFCLEPDFRRIKPDKRSKTPYFTHALDLSLGSDRVFSSSRHDQDTKMDSANLKVMVEIMNASAIFHPGCTVTLSKHNHGNMMCVAVRRR